MPEIRGSFIPEGDTAEADRRPLKTALCFSRATEHFASISAHRAQLFTLMSSLGWCGTNYPMLAGDLTPCGVCDHRFGAGFVMDLSCLFAALAGRRNGTLRGCRGKMLVSSLSCNLDHTAQDTEEARLCLLQE
ncbi:hypothetical protein DIE01_10745 [Burkholderia sp. Bp8990]|nr:hypothetical protein DIE01_10745 [Burkholderia sp. Bp8990]